MFARPLLLAVALLIVPNGQTARPEILWQLEAGG
jgi:hypothetical protein